MTREDTQKLLIMISSIFPSFEVKDKTMTVDAWHWALSEYTPEEVKAALQIYIRTNKTGFAPSVSQIISCIYSVEENSTLSEGEAWVLVRKAVSDSGYHAQERFDELPPLVKEAVGSPGVLRQWGMTDTETVNSVIMSNFQRNYRTIVKRHEFNNKISTQASKALETKDDTKRIGGEIG